MFNTIKIKKIAVTALFTVLYTRALPNGPGQNTDFSDVGFDYFGANEGIEKSMREDIFSFEMPPEFRGKALEVDAEACTYRGTPQGQTSCMFNAGGWMNSNGDPMVVGVPDKYWKHAEGCGQCFYAENKEDPSKHVLVVGADYCMGCGQFDFHKSALETLGFDNNAPTSKINIYAVPCPWSGNIKVARGPGSHESYTKLIILNSKYPVKRVTLTTRLNDQEFEFAGHPSGSTWEFDFNNKYQNIGYDPKKYGGVGSKFTIKFQASAFGMDLEAKSGEIDLGTSQIDDQDRVLTTFKTNVIINEQPKQETNDYPGAEYDLQNLSLVDTGVQFN